MNVTSQRLHQVQLIHMRRTLSPSRFSLPVLNQCSSSSPSSAPRLKELSPNLNGIESFESAHRPSIMLVRIRYISSHGHFQYSHNPLRHPLQSRALNATIYSDSEYVLLDGRHMMFQRRVGTRTRVTTLKNRHSFLRPPRWPYLQASFLSFIGFISLNQILPAKYVCAMYGRLVEVSM